MVFRENEAHIAVSKVKSNMEFWNVYGIQRCHLHVFENVGNKIGLLNLTPNLKRDSKCYFKLDG